MKPELTQALNKYVADLGLSFIKVHNLHWNVVGVQFKATHEFLESIYEEVSENLDAVAELIKMKGESPVASLKEMLELSDIKELESKEIEVLPALEILLADLKALRAEALSIHELAGDDFAVSNLMEDHIESLNKTIWFVESMLK
ncbi:MAG: Dps family protein [Eggerthellaceae bacterium]|jgi:starvation-inducible DNA-binding protein